MKNLLIMGAGRSGTSLVAGMLAGSGYNNGDNFLAPTAANPKGFFEDRTVTRINDAILRAQFPYWIGPKLAERSPALARLFHRYIPEPDQLWLAGLSPRRAEPMLRQFDSAIRGLLIEPYCYKDPRFYFTLPVWRSHLRNAGFVCVFRSPERTAESIVRECAESPYLASLRMTNDRAMRIWDNTYRWILRHHAAGGDWLFIHFDQALTAEGMDRLEAFSGARIDRAFPERHLSRSHAETVSPTPTYKALCDLARFAPT